MNPSQSGTSGGPPQLLWNAVDDYLVSTLVDEDETLAAVRESAAGTVLPQAAVSPSQGAFLALLARIAGARRVLEFGTLAGYSTVWLARAVGPQGRVVTFEIDPPTAAIARGNFERAGLADRIELVLGPALESVQGLIDSGAEPFDLVFIDADKRNNARYLDAALTLSRPGTVIVVDNVVRHGSVLRVDSDDPGVVGTRSVLDALATHPRLLVTALQTVGQKGWDGFALALVTDPVGEL